MKKFLAIFLIFILIIIYSYIPSASFANTIDVLESTKFIDTIESDDADLEDDAKEDDEFEEWDGGDELTFGGPLGWIMDGITSIVSTLLSPAIELFLFIIPNFDQIIFGQSSFLQLTFFDDKPPVLGAATLIQSTVASIYNALRYLVVAFYIIILVYLGIRVILSSVGRQKARYKELIKYWIIGLLLLFSFHWIMAYVIWFSNSITNLLYEASTDIISSHDLHEGVNISSELFSSLIHTDTLSEIIIARILTDSSLLLLKWKVVGIILGILLLLVYAIFGFIIWFTYLQRLFTIAILIVIFPVVVLAYVFDKIGDKKSQTLNMWIKEFTVNVFVQPIHALLLLLLTALLFNAPFNLPILGSIFSILALCLITKGEQFLKKLFQINSSMGPGSGGISGSLANLAHMGVAASNIPKLAGKLMNSSVGAYKSSLRDVAGDHVAAEKAYNKTYQQKRNEGKDEKIAKKAARKAQQKELDITAKKNMKKWKTDDPKRLKKAREYMKKASGSSSLFEARAQTGFKAIGSAGGIASGLASGNMTKAFSGAFTGAIAGNTAFETFDTAKMAVRNRRGLNAENALEYTDAIDKVGNLDFNDEKQLTPALKKKISDLTGLHKDTITNKNKDMIMATLAQREGFLKHGNDIKNLPDFSDPNYSKAHDILSGKNFDSSKVEFAQDKDNLYIRDKNTGEITTLRNQGNPNFKGGPLLWNTIDNSKDAVDARSAEVLKRAKKDLQTAKDNGQSFIDKNGRNIEHKQLNKLVEYYGSLNNESFSAVSKIQKISDTLSYPLGAEIPAISNANGVYDSKSLDSAIASGHINATEAAKFRTQKDDIQAAFSGSSIDAYNYMSSIQTQPGIVSDVTDAFKKVGLTYDNSASVIENIYSLETKNPSKYAQVASSLSQSYTNKLVYEPASATEYSAVSQINAQNLANAVSSPSSGLAPNTVRMAVDNANANNLANLAKSSEKEILGPNDFEENDLNDALSRSNRSLGTSFTLDDVKDGTCSPEFVSAMFTSLNTLAPLDMKNIVRSYTVDNVKNQECPAFFVESAIQELNFATEVQSYEKPYYATVSKMDANGEINKKMSVEYSGNQKQQLEDFIRSQNGNNARFYTTVEDGKTIFTSIDDPSKKFETGRSDFILGDETSADFACKASIDPNTQEILFGISEKAIDRSYRSEKAGESTPYYDDQLMNDQNFINAIGASTSITLVRYGKNAVVLNDGNKVIYATSGLSNVDTAEMYPLSKESADDDEFTFTERKPIAKDIGSSLKAFLALKYRWSENDERLGYAKIIDGIKSILP